MSADFTPPKPSFSERQGRGPMTRPLDYEETRDMILSALEELRTEDYFHQAFGFDCVDQGYVPGTLGSKPSGYLFRRTRRQRLWPYWEPEVYDEEAVNFIPSYAQPRWKHWDEDTLFDVLEVLHDLVSKPLSGEYHSWNDCGTHWHTFDQAEGQARFCRTINDTLEACGSPWEINAEGLIVRRPPDEFTPMLEAPLPAATKPETKQIVEAAVQRFRARASSENDRRLAVLDLAAVLEEERDLLKAELFSADERALFEIANGFTIRHRRRDQKDNYSKLVWHTWMFYLYLASIHAVLRIKQTQP